MNTVLQHEIATDPLGFGYAAMLPDCPGHVADKLNATDTGRTAVVSTMASARTIMSVLGAQEGADVLDKIEAAATQVPAVKRAMYFLQTETGLDIGDPQTIVALQGLVQGSVLTQDEFNDIVAIATKPVSRAQELGLSPVTALDVQENWS